MSIFEKIFKKLKNDYQDEEFVEWFYDDNSEPEKKIQNPKITEFYKYNRKTTEKLCVPLLKLDPSFYYCGLAAMPGLWIASAIRTSQKSKIKRTIIDSELNEQIKYKRQLHLVESCIRYLLRRESEKFFGKCECAITYYKDLLRFTIPITNEFIICLNIRESISNKFHNTLLQIYSLCEIRGNELSSFCISQTNTVKSRNQNDVVNDFFSINNPISEILEDIFSPTLYKTLDELFVTRIDAKIKEHTNPQFHKKLLEEILTHDTYKKMNHFFKTNQNSEPKDLEANFLKLMRKRLFEQLKSYSETVQDFSTKINSEINELNIPNSYTNKSSPAELYGKLIDDDENQIDQILRTSSLGQLDILLSSIFDAHLLNQLKTLFATSFEDDFLMGVRYASICTTNGKPLGRYVRAGTKLILSRIEEIEHLVESISRQNMRKNIVKFFGPVKYTISIYDKLVRVGIPINSDYILFITLDSQNHDELFPYPISRIFDFLKKEFDHKRLEMT